MRIGQTGVTGGEILPAHGYRDGKKDWCGVLLGLILFRLIFPPLQPRVVGPYPVWSIRFSSHLLLEGTKLYPVLLGCNRRPVVPGVQDPDNSPRAFH
jgi:hypothetical protein